MAVLLPPRRRTSGGGAPPAAAHLRRRRGPPPPPGVPRKLQINMGGLGPRGVSHRSAPMRATRVERDRSAAPTAAPLALSGHPSGAGRGLVRRSGLRTVPFDGVRDHPGKVGVGSGLRRGDPPAGSLGSFQWEPRGVGEPAAHEGPTFAAGRLQRRSGTGGARRGAPTIQGPRAGDSTFRMWAMSARAPTHGGEWGWEVTRGRAAGAHAGGLRSGLDGCLRSLRWRTQGRLPGPRLGRSLLLIILVMLH